MAAVVRNGGIGNASPHCKKLHNRWSGALQLTPGEGWKTQGRFLSSIFLGDWQLFLLSSSFS